MRPRAEKVSGEVDSAPHRMVKSMAELLEGFRQIEQLGPSVSLFGSSRISPTHPYYERAEAISSALSEAGFAVLCGGGSGLMEAISRGAFAGPSPSVGLNSGAEKKNQFQDRSLHFEHFFSRKLTFAHCAAAYVVLPGGYGTLDELSEILALVQSGRAPRVPIILVERRFWSGLIDWFRTQLLGQGMITAAELALITLHDEPMEIVDAIFDHPKSG